MPRFKHGTNRDSFGAAMRDSAASRQCPKCGRKSAIIRIPSDENYESVRYCRWEDCDYERHGSNPASSPTHGRHCPCSACRREDWSKIDNCGMHGAACPDLIPASGPDETYIELDDQWNCPHGVRRGLGCRVCDPAVKASQS